MEKHIICVGVDVHKETIALALADEGKRGDVREYGKIANTPAAMTKLMNKLSQDRRALKFCYWGLLPDRPHGMLQLHRGLV